MSVIVFILTAMPALADPPTQEETDFFKTLWDRFKNNNPAGNQKAPTPVGDILKSINRDGTQALLTLKCPHMDEGGLHKGTAKKGAEMRIKTELRAWNPNKADAVGQYAWEAWTVRNVNGQKIFESTNSIMLAVTSDTTPFEQLENELTFYHEMLHGQLGVNWLKEIMLDEKWCRAFCSCTQWINPVDGGGMYVNGTTGRKEMGSEDDDHLTINPTERKYKKNVATSYGVTYQEFTVVQRPTIVEGTFPEAMRGRGLFSIESPKHPVTASNVDHDLSQNVDTDTISLYVAGGKTYIVGRLIDPDKPGLLVVDLDPPGLFVDGLLVLTPLGGWLQVSSSDPSGLDLWASQSENASYAGPHGGFISSSNLCRVCHAVHNSYSSSYRLLRNSARQTECDFCHWSDSAVSSYKMYTVTDPKGEHSPDAMAIPDSDVNSGTPNWGNLPDRDLAGAGPQLGCYQCHSVHGADTIGQDNDHDTVLDPTSDGFAYDSSDSIENWNQKILRIDPAGDGSSLAKGAGGLTVAEWAAELSADPSAVRTGFCADCHNLNPNWARTAADADRPNKQSHVQGPGVDGQVEIDSFTTTVAWNTSTGSGCRGCHRATDDEQTPGASQFPHQSVGWKLLDDSYTTTPAIDTVGGADRVVPAMDQVCLSCHLDSETTPSTGVGISF